MTKDKWMEGYVADLVAENDRLRGKVAELERVRDAYCRAAAERCERIRVLERDLAARHADTAECCLTDGCPHVSST